MLRFILIASLIAAASAAGLTSHDKEYGGSVIGLCEAQQFQYEYDWEDWKSESYSINKTVNFLYKSSLEATLLRVDAYLITNVPNVENLLNREEAFKDKIREYNRFVREVYNEKFGQVAFREKKQFVTASNYEEKAKELRQEVAHYLGYLHGDNLKKAIGEEAIKSVLGKMDRTIKLCEILDMFMLNMLSENIYSRSDLHRDHAHDSGLYYTNYYTERFYVQGEYIHDVIKQGVDFVFTRPLVKLESFKLKAAYGEKPHFSDRAQADIRFNIFFPGYNPKQGQKPCADNLPLFITKKGKI